MHTPATPIRRRYRIVTPKLPVTRVAEDTVIGVTVFRLRPPRLRDPKARVLTLTPSGDVEWTPIRVGSDTPLDEGSLVRLSVETACPGYLYVIDREQFAGGGYGAPTLIFPTMKIRQGANDVSAGRVIDLPDRDDTPSYFTL